MISEPIRTADGSLTCRHPVYGEAYHAVEGALSEAMAKFVMPSGLPGRLFRGPVRLLDIGFGLGVNLRAAVSLPRAQLLRVDTLELESEALDRALELYPDCALTRALREEGRYAAEHLEVVLHIGDARRSLPALAGPYDLVFHDPFSPLKNTECWTQEFFQLLRERVRPDGLLLTYSESRAVRAGLVAAGWRVGRTPAVPPHRGGTLASPDPGRIAECLEADTLPFRDSPWMDLNGQDIRSRREAQIRAIREAEAARGPAGGLSRIVPG